MSWKQWLLQFVFLTILNVALTYLDIYLQRLLFFQAAYWVEWKLVAVGLYAMYLGCIMNSAVIVYGWRLSAAGIRKLQETS